MTWPLSLPPVLQVAQRDVETQVALEEVELKAMELERQRVQLQYQLARCQQEVKSPVSTCHTYLYQHVATYVYTYM